MSTNKGNRIPKDLAARRAAKQQRESIRVAGLRACRVAAALTQRELAEMVDSNQTTIADLEKWDEADLGMLKRLCEALEVAPEDLAYRRNVEDETLQATQEWGTINGFGDGNIQRRREVNLIKRRGYYADPYDIDSAAYGWGSRPPGTVLLRGLKHHRMAAGLTQRQLAEMIGSKQTTIYELEKKYTSRGAYMKTIRKLCRALSVSPADLICK